MIRAMEHKDLDAVAALDAVSSPHPWLRHQFLEELERPIARCYVVEPAPGEVTAFLCAWWLAGEWHIQNIATHPNHRRKGLARALLVHGAHDAATAGCRSALLEVRRRNEPAQALYRALGFAAVGIRPRYYAPDGDDAVLMTAALGAAGTLEPPGAAS